MIIHQENEYIFTFRSNGVLVQKGDYFEFFETLEEAFQKIFPDK